VGPVAAGVKDVLCELELGNVIGTLHHVDVETARYVPGDVAMEWPDTWVVHVDLTDHEATGNELLGITTLRVLRVDDGSVPFTDTLV